MSLKKFSYLNVIIILVVLGLMGSGGFLTYWTFASPDKTCLSCHEISDSYDKWAKSSHRNINCKNCHGGTFSAGIHSFEEQGKRIFSHFFDPYHDDMRLSERQVIMTSNRCQKCHQAEHANWLAGGHSVTYADVYLNEEHNRIEQPHDDCLRCHGMFFDGSIEEVVTPLDTKGPWKLSSADMASKPAIPCLACHQIHTQGSPAARPDYSDQSRIAAKRELRLPKVGFYDRREKAHFAVEDLPHLKLWKDKTSVQVSEDRRQRLCSQCHAPNTFHRAGTSDDRTPRGVHEGLSCLACHRPHSHEARHSCSNCHRRLSNCGLEVEKMDTTYFNPDSKHNIHFVSCSDCHVE